jgi:hypothetical protein
MGRVAWDIALKDGSRHHIEMDHHPEFVKIFVDDREIVKHNLKANVDVVPFMIGEEECQIRIEPNLFSNTATLIIGKSKGKPVRFGMSLAQGTPKWAYVFMVSSVIFEIIIFRTLFYLIRTSELKTSDFVELFSMFLVGLIPLYGVPLVSRDTDNPLLLRIISSAVVASIPFLLVYMLASGWL